MSWRDEARAEYETRRSAAEKRRQQAADKLKRDREALAAAEEEIEELDRGARVFGLIPAESADFKHPDGYVVVRQVKSAPVGAARVNALFKHVALATLERHYPHSVKAAVIQEAAEAELGRQFHWKTAGMTLYRLKKDGLAHRRGQNWFWTPPEDRPRSPDSPPGDGLPFIDVEDLDLDP